MSPERLIIFVKAPRPGMVKTRLGLGARAEMEAYIRLVETHLGALASLGDVELRFTPADARTEIDPWIKSGWHAAPQGEGDLGRRLQGAFADAFGSGAFRVVIIGSDCPYLTVADIEEAWQQLGSCDAVIGPAADGGYWLIGLRAPQPKLFEGISWSSERVLSETLSRAKSLGLKTHLLRVLSDVDTAEDWARFISSARQDRTQRPRPGAD